MLNDSVFLPDKGTLTCVDVFMPDKGILTCMDVFVPDKGTLISVHVKWVLVFQVITKQCNYLLFYCVLSLEWHVSLIDYTCTISLLMKYRLIVVPE